MYEARHHYGTNESEPLPAQHIDAYTQTKVEAEQVAKEYAQKRGVPQQVVYERLVVCDIFEVATGSIFKRADPESEYASVVFEGGNGLKVGRQQSIGSQLVVFLAIRIGYENGFDMQVAPLPEIRIVEE